MMRPMMHFFGALVPTLLLLTLLFTDATWAAAPDTQDQEDQEALMELLEILDEETEVATKTRMNNDYVPGVVTVLHGQHLQALGIHTVAEALTLLPGVQLARTDTGEPTLKVRGFSFPFNAGNVKIMLNSIALSRESSGINSSVLLMPTSQVERIEVVRGPGSTIYGDFAMAGVVNILTRKSGGHLMARAGNDDAASGSGHYTYQNREKDLEIGVNLSGKTDGEKSASIIKKPDEEQSVGIFHVDYKQFSFTLEGMEREIELDAPPPLPVSDRPTFSETAPERDERREKSWTMEGRQKIILGNHADLDIYGSYLKTEWSSKFSFAVFHGERFETGMDLISAPLENHQLLVGASCANSTIDDAEQQEPQNQRTKISDIRRERYSLGVQDQISLSQQFSITFGLRYDHYDDVGGCWTPRIAGVYHPSEHHVLKAQYAHGFRAPTFWELYRMGQLNTTLDFEVMETTELAYIYRRPNLVGRVTLFYSEIDDGLYVNQNNVFGNYVDIESKGVELEWEQQLGEGFRWQANVTYVDTWDGRTDASNDYNALGVAEWLANLVFFLQPRPNLIMTGRVKHVGERHTPEGQTDDGYNRVDVTLSRTDLFKPDLTLRLGIANIFNDSIDYLLQRPDRFQVSEYGGRACWIEMSYNF